MSRCQKLCNAWNGLVVFSAGFLGAVLACPRADLKAGPEPRMLFESLDASKTDLNDEQAKALDRIKRSKGTVADTVKLARLNPEVPRVADTAVPLAELPRVGPARVPARAFRKAQDDAGDVRVAWTGPGDAGDTAIVRVKNKDARGLIYKAGRVFAVEPLGGGVQAVYQLDQTQFDKDHPKAFEEIEKNARADKLPAQAARGKEPEPVEITVLVAYTPKVKAAVPAGNVQLLIDTSVDQANESYENSKVNLRIRVVDTVEVTYMESASHDDDLKAFRTKGDNVMDQVHDRRDASKADVCVLLIDNSQFCGLASAIGATADTAFCVVHYDCAFKNLSFAHEIGHLQGARHNPEVDDTMDPIRPFNHGFLSKMGGKWRTIMAYPTEDHPNRIPFWSNPDVKHPDTSEAMGTADKNNNARVLNETATLISGFRN